MNTFAGHSYNINKKYLYMNDKTDFLCEYCMVKITLKNNNLMPGVISGVVRIEEVYKPDEKQIKDYEAPAPPKWETMDICNICIFIFQIF